MLDAVRQRLEHAILQRGTDDQFIDRNEEREILQLAVQLGVGGDTARQLLADVCLARSFVQESAVIAGVRQRLADDRARHGRLDRQRFERLAGEAAGDYAGHRTPRECRRVVLELLDDSGWSAVRRGWFGDWLAAARREAGLG